MYTVSNSGSNPTLLLFNLIAVEQVLLTFYTLTRLSVTSSVTIQKIRRGCGHSFSNPSHFSQTYSAHVSTEMLSNQFIWLLVRSKLAGNTEKKASDSNSTNTKNTGLVLTFPCHMLSAILHHQTVFASCFSGHQRLQSFETCSSFVVGSQPSPAAARPALPLTA